MNPLLLFCPIEALNDCPIICDLHYYPVEPSWIIWHCFDIRPHCPFPSESYSLQVRFWQYWWVSCCPYKSCCIHRGFLGSDGCVQDCHSRFANRICRSRQVKVPVRGGQWDAAVFIQVIVFYSIGSWWSWSLVLRRFDGIFRSRRDSPSASIPRWNANTRYLNRLSPLFPAGPTAGCDRSSLKR